MVRKVLFVDSETDGLYGKFISIAGLLCDAEGNEIEAFYHMIDIENNQVTNPWVLENVIPLLSGGIVHETPEELVEEFWKWYENQGKIDVIADVIYPIECRLFQTCVQQDIENRWSKAPYPLLDLSSMLYACGIDYNIERKELIREEHYNKHNALDDVRMSRDIWLKYIRKNNSR